MAMFFTADTHFGHGGALGLFRRPFTSVRTMDDALIERWNKVVNQGDEVWHLGDFAVGKSSREMKAKFDALNGSIHLIIGNNDGDETLSLPGFASIQRYAELDVDGVRLILCHYPFRTWNGMAKRSINLHGHCHGRLQPMKRQIDVGVDVWDFRPVALVELLTHRPAARRR
jgi:calcineurin-like phosphoesterase family protein